MITFFGRKSWEASQRRLLPSMTSPSANGNHARIVLTANNRTGADWAGDSAADSLDRDALRMVSEYCSGISADALLIAGNLFDTPAPSPDSLLFVAGVLADLRKAGVTVGAICGDADLPPLGTASATDLFAGLGLLVNLDKVAVSEHFPLRAGPLTIAISSLPRVSPSTSSEQAGFKMHGAHGVSLAPLDRRKPADFHVLMTPAAMEGAVGTRATESTINVDAIRALVGVNMLVCGQPPASSSTMVGDTAVVMPGSPFGAPSDCGFVRLDVSAKGIEDVSVIQGLAREPIDIRIPASQLVEGGLTALKQEVEPKLAPGAQVRVAIVGRLDIELFREAGLAELSRWASKRCAQFAVDLSGLRVQSGSNGVNVRESISPFDEVHNAAEALTNAGGAGNGTFTEAAELLLKSLRTEFGS